MNKYINSSMCRMPGSFRDPESYVFLSGGKIMRWMSDECWDAYQSCVSSGVAEKLIDKGLMIGAETVDIRETSDLDLPNGHIIKHRKIDCISYPYEWSYSMLADAALLHLRLQRALLDKNLSLKDATAYNVQFEGPQPVFIDWGSIEKPEYLGIWNAYGQFCRMFLFPLILKQERSLSFVQAFMGDIGGVDVGQAYKMLGGVKARSPSCFVDVYLQHTLSKKTTQDTRKLKDEIRSRAVSNANSQRMNLDRLERKIKKLLNRHKVCGLWSEYDAIRNYDDIALADKREFVLSFMHKYKPDTVIDIGCNTGEFSMLAAKNGAEVVSLDSDPDAVELLYRRAKKDKHSILPLVANIAASSPGIGLFNEERQPLSERIQGDAVFALALLHHLLVSAQVPLKDIGRLFGSYTRRFLILEYVDPQDEMFETLVSLRKNYFSELTMEGVVDAMSESFDLVEKRGIRHSKRTLLLFEKKA